MAFLNHVGDPNPADSDLPADRPWRLNAKPAERLPPTWLAGKISPEASRDLLTGFREATPEAIGEMAAKAVEQGVAPQSVWDGLFVGAGELLMRQPGIIGLHGLTTANAMHFLWRNAADDALRRRLLLQACSFQPMFRESAKGRGTLGADTVESIQPQPPTATGEAAVAEILADVSADKKRAAARIEGYLGNGGDPRALIDGARRLIFLKGRDAHDYKFSSAVLEDFANVSPAWRARFLALSVFNLKGSGDGDNGLVARTRAALA